MGKKAKVATFIGAVGLLTTAGYFVKVNSNRLDIETNDFRIKCNSSFKVSSYNTCNLYLSEEIGSAKNYMSMSPVISSLGKGDSIYLHLAGDGGRVDGVLYLQALLKQSGAYVTSLVDGSVYSGHAFLSIAFDRTIVNSHGVIMFHNSSTTNEEDNICTPRPGSSGFETDRGVSIHDKCLKNIKAEYNIQNNYIYNISEKYLTPYEFRDLKNGWDIFLDLDDFKNRIEKLRK